MYLVTANEMQQMDRQTIESFGLPGIILMENAGRGAFRSFLKRYPGALNQRVGVFAGRGNNGGDGFVIARYLAMKNIKVTVYLLARKDKVKGDALANLDLLPPLEVPVIEIPDPAAFSKHEPAMRHQNIWIDAILGTGLKSDVKGFFKQVIRFLNDSNKPVFAVDIPSGLNSDTGLPCGICVRADSTATFGFPKIGHHVTPGTDYTGHLTVIDIGIPSHIADRVGPSQQLLTMEMLRRYYVPRHSDAHKGDTGHLMVMAGSPGKTGAAVMTSISGLRAGAGLVTLCLPESLNPVVESQSLEIMSQPLPETTDGLISENAVDFITQLVENKSCLAVGPGLGQAAEITRLLTEIIPKIKVPLVIDADGINNLSENPGLLKKAKAPIILTPHPGEMARLLKASVKSVQEDRVLCARRFSKEFNVHVVLKGAKTVIAHPDGDVFVNPTGNPGMASGGMGDVLTGVIAGLIAQKYPPGKAAHMGVYLHGAAADHLRESMGKFGYLAGDVMNQIPGQIDDIWE